jgi:cytochrome c oxidase cbb3-type subunit 3
MSSPCRMPNTRRLLIAAGGIASVVLCAGFAQAAGVTAAGVTSDFPASENGPLSVPTTTIFPGGGSAPPEDPRVKLYESNTQAIAEGQRLFNWYNCVGCHFHGAGGMGPPLMDQHWIYGGRLDQIYASIVQGRPKGMPSWSGKIPDNEIWEIAAYVKSLSAPNPANMAGQVMPTSPAPAPPAPSGPAQ